MSSSKKYRGAVQPRLTPEQVLEIRASLAAGYKQKELARFYKVCEATIGHINTRRTWKDLRPAHG